MKGCSKVLPVSSLLQAEQPKLSVFLHRRCVPALWPFLCPSSGLVGPRLVLLHATHLRGCSDSSFSISSFENNCLQVYCDPPRAFPPVQNTELSTFNLVLLSQLCSHRLPGALGCKGAHSSHWHQRLSCTPSGSCDVVVAVQLFSPIPSSP